MSKSYERQWFDKDPDGDYKIMDAEPVHTPEQEAMIEAIKGLEAEMERRAPGNGRLQYFEQELFEIQKSHYEANAERLAGLEEDAERVKAKYEARQKKPEQIAQDSIEIKRHELRYESQNAEELKTEAIQCIQDGGREWTLDRILLLNRRLKQEGIDTIGIGQPVEERSFLTWVKAKHRDEGWRYDSPETYRAIDLYSTEFGQTKTLDGNHGRIEALDIARIYNGPK